MTYFIAGCIRTNKVKVLTWKAIGVDYRKIFQGNKSKRLRCMGINSIHSCVCVLANQTRDRQGPQYGSFKICIFLPNSYTFYYIVIKLIIAGLNWLLRRSVLNEYICPFHPLSVSEFQPRAVISRVSTVLSVTRFIIGITNINKILITFINKLN